MRRLFCYVTSFVVIAFLLCGHFSTHALAGSYLREGTYRIRTSLDTSKVVDVYGGKTDNGTNIQIYTYKGGANQKFDIYQVSSGSRWYKIIDHSSGKALDVAGGVKESGTNVQLYEYNGTNAQLWSFISVGDGYYYIKNKLGYYLDVSGGESANETNVQVYSKNKTAAQKWKLTQTTDEECIISSGIDTNYVLDIYGGNSANGTNIQIYSYNDGKNQKFCILHHGGGWYAILNKSTKKAIDVQGGNKGSGVNVQLYDINYSDAQLWKFIDAGNGYYYIKNKLGYYLDVSGGVASNETNVQVYAGNNTSAQKWCIERLGVIDAYKNSSDYSTKTVNLSFNSIDTWRAEYEKSQRLITKTGIAISGNTYNVGNAIVGMRILEMKSISVEVSKNTPGYYTTETIRLPSKIQYQLHRHSFKSPGARMCYFSGDSLTFVTQCGCGFRAEGTWEIPLPEEYINCRASGGIYSTPNFKTIWTPRFYN